MDALVIATGALVAAVLGFALVLAAYLRSEQANERLKWTLDRTEAELIGARDVTRAQRKMLRRRDAELRENASAIADLRNQLATRSQQSSQEMQPQASSELPEVVALLPTAASRLANYVKEQAAMNGQALSDYEAEQAAASMLVESGI